MTRLTSHIMRAKGPLYVRVKNYILNEIGSGNMKAGDRIPTEVDLVGLLGVSRMTIHRALRELQADEVIVRTPGAGTFVADRRPQATLLAIRNIAEEIAEDGHSHSSDVMALESRKPSRIVAKELGINESQDVFHSVVVHRRDGLPVQYEERFVLPRIAPDYLQQDFTRMTTYEYLHARSPMTEVEQILSAILPDAAIQSCMNIDENMPCLLLARRTWNGNVATSTNRFVYPGSRYQLGGRYKLTSDDRFG
ncbi:MAG: histidine utilization repressor [Parvibaculaceae bacterium]